jgi:hypothetical protein
MLFILAPIFVGKWRIYGANKKFCLLESTEGSRTDDVYVMERNLTTSILTDFMKWINDTFDIVTMT